MGLTAIWLATNPRSGYFSSIFVNTPALSPVTLLLPVVAVFIAARDESTWHSHAHAEERVRYGKAPYAAYNLTKRCEDRNG